MQNLIMKNFLLTLLFISILISSAQAQQKPKIVIGIVVDQMRTDYISRYWNKFGEGGFKRLVKDGYNCRNTQYNYVPTFTGPGHASIYTGTTPSYHGIVANDWYDQKNRDTVYCVQDDSVRSIGGDVEAGKMSPARLLTTTITDELHLSTQGKSKVIGVSLKDRGAILPAGRAANAAFWYDGKSGNWISSSWYMNELPKWASDFNERKWPNEYLSKPWTTLLNIDRYTESDPDNNAYEATYLGEEKPVFPHDLPSLRGKSFDLVRRTPFGNTLTKDFSIASIKGEDLGRDSITDFLCISFSATDYVGHQFGPMAIETEDTYLRLDRDLADLFQFLDNNFGKGKYLVFLTADHAAEYNPKSLMDQKLYAGIGEPKALADSVKMFLQLMYGKSDYFTCYMNNQIYLDHTKMQLDKLDECIVEAQLARYLKLHIEGIIDALTACNLQENEYTEPFRNKMQNGYQQGRDGDVWLQYAPGWMDHLFGNGKQGTTHGSAYPYDAQVPLYWYGWNIIAGSTIREIHITDIAPTLSYLLNIGIPNGCTGKPIIELIK